MTTPDYAWRVEIAGDRTLNEDEHLTIGAVACSVNIAAALRIRAAAPATP